MTSFAKATFDVAGYLACRPSYPQRLWDIVLKYHAQGGGRFDRALDVGCGPGFVALALAPHFKSVKAIDPSSKMVSIGLQPSDPNAQRIDYAVGSAEDLKAAGVKSESEDPENGGLDLIVAGQAAHWFDYPKVWRECSRYVRPGGTVAFIGYAEMTFPDHPGLNSLIGHHARSPEALGNYWQPGRKIVEAHLNPVPFPIKPQLESSSTSNLPPLTPSASHPVPSKIDEPVLTNPTDDEVDFSQWDVSSAIRLRNDIDKDGKEIPWLLRKTFDKTQLEGYFRTFSALHDYHERHPEDLAKKGRGKDGDIVDRLQEKIWAQIGQEKEVEVGWPLVLMMIQKLK